VHVLHVSTDLEIGGAEMMLARLVRATSGPHALSHEVVSLMDLGSVGRVLRDAGVQVHALGMHRSRPDPGKLLQLTRLIRDVRPDVVQTWMYHADLMGGLAAKAAGRARIVWGIHHTTLDPRTSRWTTRATVAVCARLSHHVPDRIVCVSRAARDLHVAAGYAAGKLVVIPNGFDLEEFRADADARSAVRAELGVGEGAVLIGLVARVAPQKDHLNFVRAAAILARRAPEARFLLCGEGATPSNEPLVQAIREQGLLDRFLLLGRRQDVRRILNGLDLATLSSSHGEAFPLAVGEAMASGIPCVVTDVGDSGLLVAETGRVVRPRDPEALARGWEELVRLGPEGRRRLGAAARARIEARFGLARVAAEYAQVYRRVLDDKPSADVGGVGAE
jgi:glycosyltransferase involved in cell wall biosynthesis